MLRALSVVVLATVLIPQAFAQTAWETVTSKEGGFTVEMPVKPTIDKTRTRKAAGGTTKILMLGCTTDSGIYIVYKIELPTAVVKGTEEKQLDAERNEFASEYNGKVISEKKVRATGKIGRDFTIRGKPAEETGVLTIRVREYLDGKSIYAVMVLSAPNRELPEDAGRFLGSLSLGNKLAHISGTPEPEPTGEELKGWGLAINADKDCEFVPEEKSLTFKVPGTLHELNPDSGKLNSPRVMRSVEGDFVVTVKVSGDFMPAGKSTNPKSVPYNGAGLIIWSDSDNFIRLERGAMLRSGKVNTIVAFEEREGGYRGELVHNEQFTGGTCYLRVERKGSRIYGAISTDGTKWKPVKPIDTVWPAKLKVGLTAISSNNEPFVVKFEEFDLKTKNAQKDSK